jgi:hypothetical protein
VAATAERVDDPVAHVPAAMEAVPAENFLDAHRLRHRRVSGVRSVGFAPGRHVDYVLGRPVLAPPALPPCTAAFLHAAEQRVRAFRPPPQAQMCSSLLCQRPLSPHRPPPSPRDPWTRCSVRAFRPTADALASLPGALGAP